MNALNQTLEQLFNDFANENGQINLVQTLKLLEQNDVKDAKLFQLKIKQAIDNKRQVMDRNQFVSYFGQCDNKEHLNAVFDLIDNDGSENISKKELTAMNAKYNIGLSPNQIKAMINQISSDGQKVTKAQLVSFLSMK